MSVRVSESWTSRNGHRRTVSTGLGTYLAGSVAWCLARGFFGVFFVLPLMIAWWVLLADLWVCAELALLTVTGALAIGAVLHHEARGADITLKRGRWNLYLIGLKGARQ